MKFFLGSDKWKYVLCITLLIIYLSCALISGCVSGSEHSKLKEQYVALEKERDQLKEKVKTLEQDNAMFKARIGEQIEEIGALKRRLTDAGIAETPEEGNFEICKDNLKKIAQALKLYATDNGGLYPKRLDKISPNPKYLEFIPTCPAVTKDTYSDGYEVAKDRKAFTVYCVGNNHGNIMIKENFPQYSSASGVLVEMEKKKPSNEDEEE